MAFKSTCIFQIQFDMVKTLRIFQNNCMILQQRLNNELLSKETGGLPQQANETLEVCKQKENAVAS